MTSVEQDAATTVRVTVGRRGGGDVLRAVREAAPAGTTVREVGPTGLTWQEPILAATRSGRTAAYGRVTPSGARGLIDALADGLLEPPAFAVGASDGETFPAPADGLLGVGERRVLARCGWVDPTDGTQVGTTSAAELEAVARESGFRGRGCGDAVDGAVADSWSDARDADAKPVVIVNGTGGESDAVADRLLLESDPAAVVDAAVAVADVVDAGRVIVSLAEGDRLARNRVEAVVADFEAGHGSNAAGSRSEAVTGDSRCDISVVVGPESFETGLPPDGVDGFREAVESPTAWAVSTSKDASDARPAVIHSPRTFAGLRELSVGDSHPIGAPDDPGTRLVTVSGDTDPATVEVPTDAPLAVALGAVGDPSFQFAVGGGRLGGLTSTLDVAANVDALTAAGLGTNGAVALVDGSRCPVAAAGTRVGFAREHGCGRCEACRETVPRLHEQLRAVYAGEFDPAELRGTCATLESADCRIAAAAARPARTALAEFEPAFRSHADGRCPTEECN
jgi:NADH-quinone oxidoreductase subunit F